MSYDNRGEGNDWLRLDPGFESLRYERRFKALLKRAAQGIPAHPQQLLQ